MLKIRIGICDDEKAQREYLRELCSRYLIENNMLYDYVFFESGESVLAYEGENIHLLFLDIAMGEVNGIQVLKTVENLEKVKRIVFVSSHEEAVWDAFGRKTLGFERKPVAYQKVKKWIETVIREQQDNLVIECNTINGKQWTEIEKLYYIEAQKNYVNFHTVEAIFLVSENLKFWEEKLKDGFIIRVHKTFLVNPLYIAFIGKEVVLKNGSKLPIGRQYKEQLKKDYDAYMRRKIRGRV